MRRRWRLSTFAWASVAGSRSDGATVRLVVLRFFMKDGNLAQRPSPSCPREADPVRRPAGPTRCARHSCARRSDVLPAGHGTQGVADRLVPRVELESSFGATCELIVVEVGHRGRCACGAWLLR